LLLVGLTEDVDATLWAEIQGRIQSRGIANRVCVVEEFDHDRFRSALTRSALYIRTPTTDGVASSVLESLALGVPVVAAENGTRPTGVITYAAGNPADLADKVQHVLTNREAIARALPSPEIRDTLGDEVRVLLEG
jgi:glycosyltransferase involved in cell wall biosynthesis